MGRIDQKALDAVGKGPWRDIGEEVIIDRQLYRRYVAALRTFSEELVDRLSTQIFGDQPASPPTPGEITSPQADSAPVVVPHRPRSP